MLPIQIFEIQPDKINVELDYNGKIENHVFDMKYSDNNENYRDFNENNRVNNELPENIRVNNDYYRNKPEIHEMSGLGNINSKSIESIVNKRLEEERRDRLLNEQKTEINEKNGIITEKSKEIENLTSTIESKNSEIESLQKSIETKQSIKYYAGLTGDILQSFGIRKEAVAAPLAGFFNGGKSKETKSIQENSVADESGIIDDDTPQDQPTEIQNKRNEMIALIGEYLKGVDNSTLTNIFSIFSEIENNPSNAVSILEHLNNKR